MDADDNITDDCAKRINAIKSKPADSVYLFNVTLVNTEMNDCIGENKDFMQLRMFPNGQGLQFVGRIHEQVAGDALLTLKRFYAEDVCIEHHGYSNVEHQKNSLRRNIRLQMINAGFPENKDFFSFEIGPDIFCVYHPNTLAIWYKKTFIAKLDPFETGYPETQEARFDKMVEAVKNHIERSLIGQHNAENSPYWINDIGEMVKTGAAKACATA